MAQVVSTASLWLRYFPHLTIAEARGLSDLLGGRLGQEVAEHVRENLWQIRLWPRRGATVYIEGWERRDALLKQDTLCHS